MESREHQERLERLERKVDLLMARLGVSEADAGGAPAGPAAVPLWWGYEYRSRTTWLGMPLVHIARGLDPRTGRVRVARGVIAIGNVAIGLLAIGGVAVGGIAVGGLAVGLLALAGCALGVGAFGGAAVGLWLAVGGLAIAGQYALGGMALAPHAFGGNVQDPLLRDWLNRLIRLDR